MKTIVYLETMFADNQRLHGMTYAQVFLTLEGV